MTAHNHSANHWRSIPMPARIKRLPRDRRGYPILTSLRRDGDGRANFAGVDDVRRFIVGAFDWCGICGLPFDGEPKFLLFAPQGEQADDPISHSEAPVHEICAYYAAQVCPFLLHPDAVVRSGPGKGTQRQGMMLAGYLRTLTLTHGHNGPTFLLESCVSSAVLDEHVPERYAKLLAEDHPVRMGPAARRLLQMFESPDVTTVLMAALALTGGCDDVDVRPEWEDLRDVALVTGLRSSYELSGDPRWEGLIATREWVHEIREDMPPFVGKSLLFLIDLLDPFNDLLATRRHSLFPL